MAAGVVAGRYHVLRELGRGGMATVYLAADAKQGRNVALKVLRPDLAAAVGADRFLREIAITAALNHPHILPLLDSGEDAGLLFYVMPYVAGGSLRVPLRAGPLPLDAALRVIQEVAAALDHAHSRGVIHRDVKPENILFNDGVAVVSDFGIARVIGDTSGRITGTGLAAGTLGYMSPEQALGTSELDARSDTYSTGCVLYEMLVGSLPAVWPGAEDVTLGRFPELPPLHRERLDSFPGRVEQVLVRALALRPQHRYATSGEFAAALTTACAQSTAFTDAQVRELLRQAATLQAQAPDSEGVLTIGGVEQLAAQVGIPPVHVRQAAAALAPAGGSVPAVPARVPEGRWNRLVVVRRVEGEVPEAVFEDMVEEIQRSLGLVGHCSTLGGTLTWSPAVQGEEARRLVVQVASSGGGTEILIREELDLTGLRRLVPAGGGLSGLLLGLAWTQALGIGEPAHLVLVIPLAVLGIVTAVRTQCWIDATGRQPRLNELADALAAIARAAATRGTLALPPIPQSGGC